VGCAELFEREAETLKALSHPSIPRYLDFFEIDLPDAKQFALVQSYVEGRSLDAYLKAGRTFTEAEIKQLVKSLLEILKYLHGRKPPVIHRDIKPSNIILGDPCGICEAARPVTRSSNKTKQVYLVDFGSVQTLATQAGRTVTVVGTYGYMPPEQFGGRAVPASDLYSLGATLIFWVTGQHPTELSQDDFRIQFRQVVTLNSTFAIG
jgi:serine/threonine protein kinase